MPVLGALGAAGLISEDVTQNVTTEQMQALRTDQFRRMNEQRYARLKPVAEEFGVDIIQDMNLT